VILRSPRVAELRSLDHRVAQPINPLFGRPPAGIETWRPRASVARQAATPQLRVPVRSPRRRVEPCAREGRLLRDRSCRTNATVSAKRAMTIAVAPALASRRFATIVARDAFLPVV
jgi:hypothetical protein